MYDDNAKRKGKQKIIEINTQFQIKKIKHRSSGSIRTTAEVKFIKYGYHKIPSQKIILGDFPSISEGDIFNAKGYWDFHPNFGDRFIVTEYEKILPSGKNGIIQFLQKVIKGVGKVSAEKIVEKFGYNTFEVIEKNHLDLTIIPGITEKKALKIHQQLMNHLEFGRISTFLISQKIPHDKILDIYNKFGSTTIEDIYTSPYILLKIKGISFIEADKIAKSINFEIDNPLRIKATILYVLSKITEKSGHTYISKKKLIEETHKILITQYGFSYDTQQYLVDIEKIEKELINLDKNQQIKIVDDLSLGKLVYVATNYYMEEDIANKIASAISLNKYDECMTNRVFFFIKEFENKNNVSFASEQKEAINMAMLNKISILTGGPGTGKTHTLNALLRCIKTILGTEMKTVLIAPTGRAAKIMTEKTGHEAKTIHRAIGLNSQNQNGSNTIEYSFVIIDEFSMVDIPVFAKLLDAIDIETCKILIIGDYDQLPSVGPGLILKDLIDTNLIPCTRLSKIFRQAESSQIVTNAHAIIKGEYEKITYNQKNKDDFYFIQCENNKIFNTMVKTIEKLINKQNFSLSDIQVLSPFRNGEVGTKQLNYELQNHFNKTDEKNICKIVKREGIEYFKEGDKVIHTTNNYNLNVFNGEVGKIDKIENKIDNTSIIYCDYEDKYIEYDNETAEELELAYAITIHKSQGSEYPIVIVPLYNKHGILLNRNILYTAVTRAKEKFIFIGDIEMLKYAVAHTKNTKRDTKIKEKIITKIKELEDYSA